MCSPELGKKSKKRKKEKITHPTMVSHLVVVVGLCTDDPKDF